jgi:hypothetical protein
MLQGDALAVQLFIGAAAISALSVAMTQAGWTHKWFIGGMFGLAALLSVASIGWPYIEGRTPLINDALQTASLSRIAWFFAGIIPALVLGIRLGDWLHRRSETPKNWHGIFDAMEKLARQDLRDRCEYVKQQVFATANKCIALEPD